MSGTGTSSRTRGLRYSCILAARMTFPFLRPEGLSDHGSRAIEGRDKTPGHLVVRRWVLTGDELAIFDHERLEDSFVGSGDVAAGDLQGVVDVKRDLGSAH